MFMEMTLKDQFDDGAYRVHEHCLTKEEKNYSTKRGPFTNEKNQ